jgi:hypothetical protein
MEKKHPLITAGLALVVLTAVAYLTTALISPAKDRPTLMYFRADL